MGQRRVDESRELGKTQTGWNQVNFITYEITILTTSRNVEAFGEVDT